MELIRIVPYDASVKHIGTWVCVLRDSTGAYRFRTEFAEDELEAAVKTLKFCEQFPYFIWPSRSRHNTYNWLARWAPDLLEPVENTDGR